MITTLRGAKPSFTELQRYKLDVCQLVSWDSSIWNDELAGKVAEEAREKNVHITSFWAGYCPPRD